MTTVLNKSMWICIHSLTFLRKIPLLKIWGQFNNMYFIFIEIDSWKNLCTIDLEKLQRLARSTTLEIVFCFQNCSDLQWEQIVVAIKKNFWNWRLKAGTIYSNSERAQQFLKQNAFLTCSLRFLRSKTLEQ